MIRANTQTNHRSEIHIAAQTSGALIKQCRHTNDLAELIAMAS